ncbi:MAG: hypothetical protein ACOX66_04540 [Oscillospiraceae bacterium]|jgi:poly-gamma-glutamate capsule biosynthesis protein CapA/YwtB (metallophosphatase superfamily)
MATFVILAAFGCSLLLMMLLWSLKDFLLKPRRARKKSGKLALLILDENIPEESGIPEAAETSENTDIRSGENDGRNGQPNTDIRNDPPAHLSK